MQIGEDGWRRIPPLRNSTGQNQRSVGQQQQPNKEPYRNNVMSFTHEPYQKTFAESLPKNDLQNHEQHESHAGPKNRLMQQRHVFFFRNLSEAIYQHGPFRGWIRMTVPHE